MKKWGWGSRKREKLLMWLSWHVGRGNVCLVKEGERIVAAGVARRISNETDSRFSYATDEQGEILFVEQVAAKNNRAFLNLLRYVIGRWPDCKKIMFHRGKSASRNRIYPMNSFLRKAFNL